MNIFNNLLYPKVISHLYNSFIKSLSQPVYLYGLSPVLANSIYMLPSIYSTKYAEIIVEYAW